MSALSRLPAHLRKYVVEQNYTRYTDEDQAVWRFIMRQLKDYLGRHAHECYLEGLQKTGISIDRIPRIEEIDALLNNFGWGAIPVSGFIPPAAFMEFQSLGILPVASDMRTLEHIQYTPAPDIVHEAGGHAPILIHPGFAEYLRKYANVARYAIISKEDMDQYHAIRTLSDLKENPGSTPAQIREAEETLVRVNQSMKYVSEATLLSRMNWWTAEYGLIGDPKAPKIYGAGLLSSVGESKECLSERVKKIPLDINCVDVSYDITEPQPQLFVTPDFKSLHLVLDQLAEKMAFRRGGVYGLKKALEAETINTVQLNPGIQISGIFESYLQSDEGEITFIKFRGPCQLSVDEHQLPNQGTERHAHGFSSPMGRIKSLPKGLSEFNRDDLTKAGFVPGKKISLEYESGIILEGKLKDISMGRSHLQILTFSPCKVTKGDQVLFDPAWGEFDLAVGEQVLSVFGGPADRSKFGETDDFVAQQIPMKKWDEASKKRFATYAKIRQVREAKDETKWFTLTSEFLKDPSAPWLQGVELLEIGHRLGKESQAEMTALKEKLAAVTDSNAQKSIGDGLRLANKEL
jgi:phenylalanine-4-hydroxylase